MHRFPREAASRWTSTIKTLALVGTRSTRRLRPSPTRSRACCQRVLPYPELVDEHAHLRAVFVVADALREEVHVLRNHERHPWCSVGELAVNPLPECARPGRVAQLLCLRRPHQAVDARVAEPGVLVVAVPGQERWTAEANQE